MPKPNMYQSLHTSVMTDTGQPFEVQIRTHEMHRVAEEGIAAHWQYKEGGASPEQDAEKVGWLRQILEWQQDLKDPREFMRDGEGRPVSRRRSTPSRRKGKVLSFPRGRDAGRFRLRDPHRGRPPLHRRQGQRPDRPAEVRRSQNGDIVEILTQPGAPSEPRLADARARPRARASKIRAWLNANERARSVALGRGADREGAAQVQARAEAVRGRGRSSREALRKLGCATLDDFYAAVGYGKVTPHALLVALVPEPELQERSRGRRDPRRPARAGPRRPRASRSAAWTT